MKKILLFSFCLLFLFTTVLSGCSTVDVLDNQVDDLVQDYYNTYVPNTPNTEDKKSVLDTLNLLLDEYVSGLKRPSFNDIQNTTITPDSQGDSFQKVDGDCASIDEMKAYILQGLSDTADKVTFYIPASIFSFETLYDVIFIQICETYMIETMGMQSYTSQTMQVENGKLAVSVDFSYFNDKYSLNDVKQMKKQTFAKAKEVIRQLDLANKTEYEQVYAVNRYLCDNCVYPEKEPYSDESHTPYGALIEQSAVCEGYARSAQLIFSLIGLESYFVTGDTPEGGHAWNLVKVDKNYYQLDITWNDSTYQSDMYFLVTDDYMKLSRTWDEQRYPSSANEPYKKEGRATS